MLSTIPGPIRARLFFAVLPPDDACAAIEGLAAHLQSAHRLQGRPITGTRIHNTLAQVYDEHLALKGLIARARSIGARIRHRPFPVRFDWTQSFKQSSPRHPFVLRGGDGVKPLASFRHMLAAQMRAEGLMVPQSYTPHVTLLWADQCVSDYPIYPICWTVEDFVLVLSLQGQSRHVHLARWSLQ
jgi:RNA 2',3'-cyclic 3'-phosphodiesterase